WCPRPQSFFTSQTSSYTRLCPTSPHGLVFRGRNGLPLDLNTRLLRQSINTGRTVNNTSSAHSLLKCFTVRGTHPATLCFLCAKRRRCLWAMFFSLAPSVVAMYPADQRNNFWIRFALSY